MAHTQQEGVPMDAARSAASEAGKRDQEARVRSARRVPPFRVGDRVRAFHPLTLGVVHYGDVIVVGRVRALIDFGPMLGGQVLVRHIDVLEVI